MDMQTADGPEHVRSRPPAFVRDAQGVRRKALTPTLPPGYRRCDAPFTFASARRRFMP